jgi:c-di-GMP-binding flagellar brake protein YcgR
LELLAFMDNRVDLPRVELIFPATVLLGDEQIVHVSGCDISPGGIGISCDGSTAKTMVNQGSLVSPDAGAVFHLRWALPRAGTHAKGEHGAQGWKLEGRARLAWSRPASAGKYRLGLKFLALDDDARRNLTAFIDSVMQ